jgi:hypothetical protein
MWSIFSAARRLLPRRRVPLESIRGCYEWIEEDRFIRGWVVDDFALNRMDIPIEVQLRNIRLVRGCPDTKRDDGYFGFRLDLGRPLGPQQILSDDFRVGAVSYSGQLIQLPPWGRYRLALIHRAWPDDE